MPKLYFKERLGSGLEIGVQSSQGTPNFERGKWTARIKLPDRKSPVFKSLDVPYRDGHPENRSRAEKIAWDIYEELKIQERNGGAVVKGAPDQIHQLFHQYLDETSEWAEINDRAKNLGNPMRYKVHGGRGNSYWTVKKWEYAERIFRLHIAPFIYEELPKRGSRGKSPHIKSIQQRDWDRFESWLAETRPELSVETHLKIITEVRHLYAWAYAHKNEYVDYIPAIQRPSRGGVEGARERMRREITPQDYRNIILYTRQRYMDPENSSIVQDYAYLFHLYILILANTGIRPPTGKTDHTLIRWEDLKYTEKDGRPYLQRNEKGHKYNAIILPSAITYIEELKKFYQSHGIRTESGVIFVHPYDSYNQESIDEWEEPERVRIKGEPIYSFRRQWERMRESLELVEPKVEGKKRKQSDGISFSSLRAWFITQRLYSSEDIKIELLARACGTSVSQIEARYLRLDMDRQHEYLSAGAYDNKGKKRKYNKRGFYIGHED